MQKKRGAENEDSENDGVQKMRGSENEEGSENGGFRK